ncbi:MAG: response regulator transcription factor [Methylobacteriaceae bacterium]|nr:response regulator transcription factor [Methylobacteriaceae bacterium]
MSQSTTDATQTRVMIVEDQQLIRRAFRTMLSLEADIDVIAEAGDGHEAVRLAKLSRPDVILMDLQMPRMGGVAATRQILADQPEVRIVVLTTFDTDEMVFDAISAGAVAYLLKDADEAEILATIRGETRVSPSVAAKLMGEVRRTHRDAKHSSDADYGEPLTEREHTILNLVAAGRSNKEIANELHLAEGTIKNYVSRVMEKLEVRSRTELAVKALKTGRT